MSLPDKDWFVKVDSVTSLVGHRRYGLEDEELVRQLLEISREARQFAYAESEEVCGHLHYSGTKFCGRKNAPKRKHEADYGHSFVPARLIVEDTDG